MKNSKKGFAGSTIIGLIVLLAAIIAIVLVVNMKKGENQEQPTGGITLSSRNGLTYIGGKSLEVMIDGDVNLLNCSSGDEKIATCNIVGSKLIVTPQTKAGETSIFVMNSNNERVVYNVMVKEVVLGLSNLSGKTYTNGDSLLETITGSNYGTLSCTSNDTEIATCNVSGNTLVIEPGSVVGATTIKLSEDNVNKSVEYNVSVEKTTSTTPTTKRRFRELTSPTRTPFPRRSPRTSLTLQSPRRATFIGLTTRQLLCSTTYPRAKTRELPITLKLSQCTTILTPCTSASLKQ